jgi:hypothetical protein
MGAAQIAGGPHFRFHGADEGGVRAERNRAPGPEVSGVVRDRRLLTAGVMLLVGGAITLALHAAGAPEALLDFLYDRLLSGLDVPSHPSATARDIVNWVSLVGGVAELLAGSALLALAFSRPRHPRFARAGSQSASSTRSMT